MPCTFQIDDVLGETVGCQFGVDERDLIEFDGKAWCHFHLPLQVGGAASEKTQWNVKQIEAFNEAIFERIDRAKAASEKADLSGVGFPAGLSFELYARDGLPEVSFRKARFGEKCSFDNIIFASYASFEAATFTASARFARANFSTLAKFDDIAIAGTAWSNEATFGGNARFLKARFADKA